MALFLTSNITALFSQNPPNHSQLPTLFPKSTLPFPHFTNRRPCGFRTLSSKPTRRTTKARTFPPDSEDTAGSSSSSVPDEWGEKPSPVEPVAKTDADPPLDEDEWGEKPSPVDPVAKTDADPPLDEDEWGRDVGVGNGSPASVMDEGNKYDEEEIGQLKQCLVDSFYGTEYGLKASTEVRAEILELVSQLEAKNPTPAPLEALDVLDGNWVLLYTAFSELLPLIAVGSTPFLNIKRISQVIDNKKFTILNVVTLTNPFATFSFSASASFEVRSPSRIQVRFKEGIFQPPEISSTINLPEKIDVFGQKIDLLPLQGALNPVQQAAASITRAISGQPPLKVSIPGERSSSWLLTTFLDEDLRISRGDGGLFVLAKEGSPLLDQL